MKTITYLLIFLISGHLFSQVGIGTSTPDSSSVLDLASTNKGLYIPKYALTSLSPNQTAISNPANGLLIYNTGGSFPTGIYFWNQTTWEKFHILGDFDESFSISISSSASPDTPLVNTTTATGTLPGFIQQANTISGSVPASVDATTGDITLPKGMYKVQVKLDSTIKKDAGWNTNAYYQTPANAVNTSVFSYQNVAVNAVFLDASNNPITDVQTVSNMTEGTINGYEYSFWLNLTGASNVVKLKLYYDTTSTTYIKTPTLASTYHMLPQQSGLKVSILRIK